MRALRIVGPGAATIEVVEPPVPAEGEVLVDVAVAAVCNTDRKLVRCGLPPGRTPGHEVAGRLADGTAVGVHPDVGCGQCPWCLHGQTNRCPWKWSLGIDRDGGLAGRLVVPRDHAVPLDGVPLELAPLLEPLACCVHAHHRLGSVTGPAVVVGGGAMGILTTWVLQAAGHRTAVCQRSPGRRRLAAGLGADAVLGPDEDPAAVLGEPVSAIVVTAPGAEPLRWALEHVAEGGVVHAFAGTPGGADVDANVVHYRHLDLVGSTGSGLRDYREAIALVSGGSVPLDRFPVVRTDLDGAVTAVTTPAERQHLRTVIDLAGDDR
ncbi:alcohol dehydrogenase catalytic domain-containing protein [Egicoccus sp. AB-alg2]|uniref:alcohol dehydrogenase catalytic domain-containing protein n=1 Tax=Egicoccus sp. AB-alg2 TaxID=3242693 RepID=UPI00359F0403